ncbi:hypothetical protein [Thermus thermamylovorans]|uniref:Uncharacterized protein n=1 Tax=Thermus thermamylovorans TaxID=2509362 RepID=A0A4Q9B7C7_9DEIN|nr:hypothetical protein [Thermus thermamylovorans]TBH21012.1 hypothetical protein ETP66_04350 [Thermus thermamylovorans]
MGAFLARASLGLGLFLTGLWALGQSLSLPERAQVGETLVLEGRDLPQGRFPLRLEAPDGVETLEVETREGSFRLEYAPRVPGEHRLRLSLPSGVLEGRFLALGPAAPELTPEGLRLPWGLLPLPEGPWAGPLVQGERVYVAQGLLVLEAHLGQEGVGFHFAPAPVLALRPGPEALLQGDWTLPIPFPPLPFEGEAEDLEALGRLLKALAPPKPWPYFAYWTQDPAALTPQDLEAYGQDLRARHHRPELLFGLPGVTRMAEASRALRATDGESALRLAETLLRHTPLFPDSLAFFRETAEFLEAQGQPARALRFREAEKALRTWLPPELSPLIPALWTLGLAYLGLMLYLFLFYLPGQLRDLRAIGGYLLGFFRHPLLRLRHLHLAYASLGERVLAFLLLLALGAGLLLQGLDARVRETLLAPPLDRGTLRTQAAQDWLRTLPETPETRALLGYALLPQAPREARGLLEEATWPFALALKGDEASLAEAYRRAPWEGPVRGALGLGQDPWGLREPGPSARALYLALLRVELGRFLEDPLRGFLRLPTPLPEGARPWVFLALVFLTLYHLLGFLLPRRPASLSPTWVLLVRLLVPGSPAFSAGVGLLLLLLAAYGLLTLLEGQGPWVLLLAYALHLFGVVWNLRKPA